jgi:hypothetical protein
LSITRGSMSVLYFINEFDVLKAYEAGKDLSTLTAEYIMRPGPMAVHASTTIGAAVQMMEEQHVLNLPVEIDGKVVYSVSRHDLLRGRRSDWGWEWALTPKRRVKWCDDAGSGLRKPLARCMCGTRVNNYLHRSILIGCHIRSDVRDAAACEPVTAPTWERCGDTCHGLQLALDDGV